MTPDSLSGFIDGIRTNAFFCVMQLTMTDKNPFTAQPRFEHVHLNYLTLQRKQNTCRLNQSLNEFRIETPG